MPIFGINRRILGVQAQPGRQNSTKNNRENKGKKVKMAPRGESVGLSDLQAL